MDRVGDGTALRFRWLKRHRAWLVVGALLLLLSVLLLPGERGVQSVRRELIAKRDLSRGERFSPDDFRIHPNRSLSNGEGVTDQQIHLLSGATYAVFKAAGEPLKFTDLELGRAAGRNRAIARGHRAYTIPVENARLVRSGDRIDILLRPNNRDSSPVVLVSDVEVLDRSGPGERADVTVSVPRRELQLLEKALQQGKLAVALLGEKEPTEPRRPRPPGRERRALRIEILNE